VSSCLSLAAMGGRLDIRERSGGASEARAAPVGRVNAGGVAGRLGGGFGGGKATMAV
jgi:hypothetical protein